MRDPDFVEVVLRDADRETYADLEGGSGVSARDGEDCEEGVGIGVRVGVCEYAEIRLTFTRTEWCTTSMLPTLTLTPALLSTKSL